MTDGKELEYCPFCGEDEAELHTFKDEFGSKVMAIRCPYCGATGETGTTREYVMAVWNTRNHKGELSHKIKV